MPNDFTPGLPPPARKPLVIHACSGLLFVGDPHLTCVRPGRRLESDFLAIGEDKLAQAHAIAQANDFATLFLGDLLDNPGDKKSGTTRVVEHTGRLIRAYARAFGYTNDNPPRITPACPPGNHDMDEAWLTDDTTLRILGELGFIDVMEPAGAYAIYEIDGKRVGVGSTPYGHPIPRDVRGAFGDEPVDTVIWITHALFAFDKHPPGVPDPFEILGCDMVVNGHDHTTQQPKQVGCTRWFNPGNITRMSVDCVDHIPSVWSWKPGQTDLVQIPLRYNQVAFDLVGRQVEANPAAADAIAKARERSQFAELLTVETAADRARTDAGEELLGEIEAVLDERQARESVRMKVRDLHRRAPEKLRPM